MPVISRLVSIILRIAEIGFAAVVAGVIGHYLAKIRHAPGDVDWWGQSRFIYSEVIAGISILLGLIWLIPFSSGFFSWPLDILISCAWFASFGVLVDYIKRQACGGIWSWHFGGWGSESLCGTWKAAEAFSFLSAIVWLASGLVVGVLSFIECRPCTNIRSQGIWFTFRTRPSTTDGTHRRRWGRSAV
ncbi:unnamed protein product [Penicillium salamii]|uniref:MARVEL domain-containing protein n=1 Tax=Penicillium salamii TaxID=1612424 RepID=A0A9W4K0H4_9EURO|nr:unnamed protein product [Penicillium salamii]CAG8337337.1 unnamed protein product [Penicillium salamii]CAG8337520.1 unnamed protein product [Penicillium salamii]CAG8387288.1 unnamed protein product [Penicillium salamii]CAG8396023.1 unnamed protein product [Penicillium salamii]